MIGLALVLRDVVHVHNSVEFLAAMRKAKPGCEVLLEPGEYQGGVFIEGVNGTVKQSIIIRAADPSKPPVFVGGGSSIQISKCSWLDIRNITIKNARDNGLNIDDGGDYGNPVKGISLEGIKVSDLPKGNHDGIKLSGLTGFLVERCTVERWGGSAIDMVGCRNGLISESVFRDGGDSGVQMKGGTTNVLVNGCRFENAGERSLNLGGSTGRPFFRPPLDTVASGSRFEGKDLTVRLCTIIGSTSPFAFVGVDGATVTRNTIYHPERWAIRILQETNASDFVQCRNGVFESNLIVFKSDHWFSGGVNIGPNTQANSFKFAKNFWYCEDIPARSRPSLPNPEPGGIYGVDPKIGMSKDGRIGIESQSPAHGYGTFR